MARMISEWGGTSEGNDNDGAIARGPTAGCLSHKTERIPHRGMAAEAMEGEGGTGVTNERKTAVCRLCGVAFRTGSEFSLTTTSAQSTRALP